jgi:ABC-type hemin transport system substrate-binding protein
MRTLFFFLLSTFCFSYERIISFSTDATEILRRLQLENKIIAVGEFADTSLFVSSPLKIKTGAELDLEQLITLNPDLIILPKTLFLQEDLQQMQQLGLNVIIYEVENINKINDNLQQLGQVLQISVDKLLLHAPNLQTCPNPQTILILTTPIDTGIWAAGRRTIFQQIIERLNLTNIVTFDNWQEISAEEVIRGNPQNLLIVTEDFSQIASVKKSLFYQNQNIIKLDNNQMSKISTEFVGILERIQEQVVCK